MKALVTGAAGFIGSHLASSLVSAGHEVVGIDCLNPYYDPSIKRANLHSVPQSDRFTFIEADLNELDLDGPLKDVDVIFHLAGQPGVRASWGDGFDGYVVDNVSATQRLLEAAKGSESIRKFVYASSSSIYGDAESFPTRESEVPRPVSPYGVTKLAGEHLVMLYAKAFDLPGVALRYFTIYGPRQRPDMAFNRFIRAAIVGETVEIFGDGLQIREFTYVEDCVRATLAAAEFGKVGVAYNIGGGAQTSILEVIDLLGEFKGKQIDRVHLESMKGDARRTMADTSRCLTDLGVVSEVSLRDGLQKQFSSALEAIT